MTSTAPDARPIARSPAAPASSARNLADRLLARRAARCCVFDNLSRPGVERNLAVAARSATASASRSRIADVRDARRGARGGARRARRCSTSPRRSRSPPASTTRVDDFEVNARGTLNVLEAVRAQPRTAAAALHLDQQGLRRARRRRRSRARGDALRAGATPRCARAASARRGRSTSTAPTAARRAPPTSTCSTTRAASACRRVVFRMSCIYGPHQFGTEDQGWVAHFLIRALERRADHVYGDGMQVRDVLFVDDLVDAFLLRAGAASTRSPGRPSTSAAARQHVSLLELLELIGALHGRAARRRASSDWRPGDQRYYVSDTRALRGARPAGRRRSSVARRASRGSAHWLLRIARLGGAAAADRERRPAMKFALVNPPWSSRAASTSAAASRTCRSSTATAQALLEAAGHEVDARRRAARRPRRSTRCAARVRRVRARTSPWSRRRRATCSGAARRRSCACRRRRVRRARATSAARWSPSARTPRPRRARRCASSASTSW